MTFKKILVINFLEIKEMDEVFKLLQLITNWVLDIILFVKHTDCKAYEYPYRFPF